MAFRNIPPNGFPAIPDIEDLEGVEKDIATLKTTAAGLAEDVSELRSGLTGKLNFSAYAMDGSATVNIYHYSMVIVMSDRGGLYFDGTSNRGLQALVPSEAVTVAHVDGTNLTVKNNSQYGTNIIVLSDSDITISAVS